MRGYIYFVTALFICQISAQSQTLIGTSYIGEGKAREMYFINGDSIRDSYIYFGDKKNFDIARFSESSGIEKHWSFPKKDKSFNDFLGSFFTGENINLVFSDKKFTTFSIVNFNPVSEQITKNKLSYTIENEEFLNVYKCDSKLYVFSIIKSTSHLKVYTLTETNVPEVHIIDLSNYVFNNSIENTLYAKLKLEDFDVPVFPSDKNLSLTLSTKQNKLFFLDNNAILLIDGFLYRSILININLDDYSFELVTINQPTLKGCSPEFAKSNSFISDTLLFQINVCQEQMLVSVSGLKSKKELTLLTANRDEDISWNSSGFHQHKGGSDIYGDSNRELAKTKQILRKLANSNPGLVVVLRENKIYINIGAYKEQKVNNWGAVTNPATANTGSPGSVPGYNNTYYTPNFLRTYNERPIVSQHTTKEVSFETVLDAKTFRFLEEEEPYFISGPSEKTKEFLESFPNPNSTPFSLNPNGLVSALIFNFKSQTYVAFQYSTDNSIRLYKID